MQIVKRAAVTLAAVGALCLLGAECRRIPPNPPPGPDAGPVVDAWIDPWADAATEDAGPPECIDPLDQCDRAACRLARLGCPERTTPNGTPFSQACHDSLLDGRYWPTQCIVAAESCEQARACR